MCMTNTGRPAVKPAGVKWVTAKFPSTCPQCGTRINVGDRCGQPQQRNRYNGRLWIGVWHCTRCALWFAAAGEVIGLPFINEKARDDYNAAVAFNRTGIEAPPSRPALPR